MKNARPRGQFSESPRRRNIAYLEKQEEAKNPRRLSQWFEKHFHHASEPEGGISRPILKENVEAIVKGNSDLEVFK